MKRTIEIDDTLAERTKDAIEELKNLFNEYCDDNTPDESPCISNDLDYSGRVHEIVDDSVPIYTKEIDDTWYLHSSELEEAYEDSGIGENPRENNGMTAIYCLIDREVRSHYEDNKEDWFEEWQATNRAKRLANVEVFEVTDRDFLGAGDDDWRATRLAEEVDNGEASDADKEAAAEKLAGFYWWNCLPGCMPASGASGPFIDREDAEDDALENN